MVGEHEKHRLVIDVAQRLPNDLVHALVEVFDDLLIAARGIVAMRGMVGLQIAIEHVLDAVAGIEHARDDALAGPLKRVEVHRLALFADHVCLIEKGLLIDHPLVERPSVLGEPQGGEGAEQLRQIGRVVGRMRDRQSGLFRVDVDGREIERNLRAGLGEHEARDAADLHAEPAPKGKRNPWRILARRQFVGRSVQPQGRLVIPGQGQIKRQTHRLVVVPHWARRTFNRASQAVSIAGESRPRPALEFHGPKIGRELLKAALGSEQVGSAHGGQQFAVKLLRREGDRHAQHRRADMVLAQDAPKRPALASHLNRRAAQRKLPSGELQPPGRGPDT